ncbi:MAG: TolC family protein [Sedimentisphaerales bacterium]|nr:TolC family protein [Sedimentisphaerales bacterium]
MFLRKIIYTLLVLIFTASIYADSNEPPRNSMTINIEQAILLAMENNRSLIVQKMNPEIRSTYEQEERSVFDPVIGGDISQRRTVADRLSRAGSSTESQTVDTINGSVSLDKYFSSGTNLSLEGSSSYTDSSLYSDTFVSNRLGITVTQALLQGLDVRANMARVHQASLDTLISEYELRGFSEVLLEAVEIGFWNYALAQKQIEIYTNSLDLAQQQMDQIQERINIGTLAETELAAAKAEVALRKENLITARSILSQTRLNLLVLLNPSDEIDWNMDINLQYQTALPEIELDDVEQHVKVAMKMRPDLNEARLLIKRGELEVVKTKNGLLPRLDAFITFGKSGYANTFDKAMSNMDENSYDAQFGLMFQYPVSNKSAKARNARAVLSKQQMLKAYDNLVQLAQVDIRWAYIDVTSAREQITATTATRNLQEEKLRVENEKFSVGRSTSLLVAQAQRDLVASQIAEIQANVNYFQSLVSLFGLEGSLLQRRGIEAHGIQTVTLE